MLKKINAIIACIVAVLVLIHMVLMSLLLIGAISFNPVFNTIGKILLRTFVIHIFISMIIMFFNKGNGFTYPKLNKSTIEQRLASIFLLVFIHFHMSNYFVNGSMVQPSIFRYITEILFAVLIMCHFAPSIDKGLLTWGINNKVLTNIIKIIFLVAFALSIVSVSKYFLGAII